MGNRAARRAAAAVDRARDLNVRAVGRDVAMVVDRSGAIPPGYAVTIVVVKAPTEGQEALMTVMTIPAQETAMTRLILEDAAKHMTGEVETHPRVKMACDA